MNCNFYNEASFFFSNDTATTKIYTLSLPDALPIWSKNIKGTEEMRPQDRLDRFVLEIFKRTDPPSDAEIGRAHV